MALFQEYFNQSVAMETVESYLAKGNENQRSIMRLLNDWLIGFPGMKSTIQYGVPFYGLQSWICYLNPIKTKSVELVFINGIDLLNAKLILDARNRKQVAGILFSNPSEIDFESLNIVLIEAVQLDDLINSRKP